MEAFLFVITIPTAKYERYLRENANKSTESHHDKINNASFQIECEISKNISKTSDKFLNAEEISNSSKINFLRTPMKLVEPSPVSEGNYVNVNSVKRSPSKTSLSSYMEDNCRDDGIKVSTPIRKTDTQEVEPDSLERVISETLSSLGISPISWTSSTEQNHFHISFGIQGGAHCEIVLHELQACGVGSRADSTLSVLPCALHYGAPKDKNKKIGKTREMKDSAWNTFVQSVRSRLTVAQLLEQVKAEAALTFDFFFLLIVAALTAAIGLAENSTVCLVASMLISPLMGPIMAGTFGTAIQDKNLQKIGVIHELVGIFVTMIVGFVFGLIICGIDENYGVGEWPTSEIMSRCEVRSLWVGALVALPSGAAVAISVLAGNTTSLVGVAISASLLPPAVNAGLMWAMSLIHLIFLNDDTRFTNVVKTQNYSDNPATELAISGSISLLLTVINIVCIFVAGILVLMIKNVSPVGSSIETEWQKDIKAARDFNKKLSKEKCDILDDSETFATNRSDFENVLERAFAWEAFHLTQRDMVERLKVQSRKHMTWSPSASVPKRPTVQDLYGMYRRLSETPSTSKATNLTPLQTVGQNYSRLVEESPGTSEKSIEKAVAETLRKKTKFTITPVEDPTYNFSNTSATEQ